MSFNKVILMGNLTADVELKQTPSGVPVTNFTIAINRPYAKEGEQNTDFINCVAWNKLAEFICRNFSKGKSILLWGNIQNRNWTDKDGNKRTTTEVVALEAAFCGKKEDSGASTTSTPPPPYSASREEFEEMTGDDPIPF